MNWAMPVLVFALIFSSCVSNKKYTELMDEKMSLEESLAAAQKKVSTLEDAVKNLEEEKSKLMADYEADKASWASQLNQLEGDLNAARTELADAKKAAKEREDMMMSSIKSVFSPYEGDGMKLMEKDGRMYISLVNPIQYRSGSTRITKAHKPTIEAIANLLKNNPTIGLMVEGHSDSVPMKDGASWSSNMELSLARANRVVSQLVKGGASPSQLTAIGRGSKNPAAEGDHNANRRTEFIIIPDLTKLYRISTGA